MSSEKENPKANDYIAEKKWPQLLIYFGAAVISTLCGVIVKQYYDYKDLQDSCDTKVVAARREMQVHIDTLTVEKARMTERFIQTLMSVDKKADNQLDKMVKLKDETSDLVDGVRAQTSTVARSSRAIEQKVNQKLP